MPNISSHMAVAKRIDELLKINNDNFYRGNLFPDLFQDKNKSHYKIPGSRYLIPDIEYVKENLNLKDKKNLGILTHLLLDKYYLEEYLINIKDNVFESKRIYNDYDILNKDIIEHFKLDLEKLNNILNNYVEEIDIEKLNKNLDYLNNTKEGTLEFLNKEDFIKFLNNISIRIADEIKEYN